MPKIEKLRTFLYRNDLYETMSRINISYTPDMSYKMLRAEMTGSEEQYFETELNHIWVPFVFKDDIYLAARELTNYTLLLKGLEGYRNGVWCQEQIAALYDNETFGIKGVALSEEMYKSLPVFLREKKGKFWITERSDVNSFFGFKIVVDGNMIKYTLYSQSFFKGVKGNQSEAKASLLPIVKLPKEILVDLSVAQGEPLRLIAQDSLGEGYIVSKEEMAELVSRAKSAHANDILNLLRRIQSNK